MYATTWITTQKLTLQKPRPKQMTHVCMYLQQITRTRFSKLHLPVSSTVITNAATKKTLQQHYPDGQHDTGRMIWSTNR